MFSKLKELYIKYKEIINYVFFGGLTTVVNIVAYLILAKIIGIEEGISNVIAIILSIFFAYVTNKIFVFESKTIKKKEILKEMISFFGCRAFTSLIDIGLFNFFVYTMQVNDVYMKIINQVIIIILNYILSKVIVFPKSKNKKEKRDK